MIFATKALSENRRCETLDEFEVKSVVLKRESLEKLLSFKKLLYSSRNDDAELGSSVTMLKFSVAVAALRLNMV